MTTTMEAKKLLPFREKQFEKKHPSRTKLPSVTNTPMLVNGANSMDKMDLTFNGQVKMAAHSIQYDEGTETDGLQTFKDEFCQVTRKTRLD